MDYEIPEDPYTEKDKTNIWICSSCNKIMKTVENERPEKCPDCLAGKYYIEKYHHTL